MSNGMKHVSLRTGTLHVETPVGIINIFTGLRDEAGRAVVAIHGIPDEGVGEVKVKCRPACGFRMVRNLRKTPRR